MSERTPQTWGAASVLVAVLITVTPASADYLLPEMLLDAEVGQVSADSLEQQQRENLLASACPGSHIRGIDLDAGRAVNDKLALAAAIRRAAALRDAGGGLSLRERMREYRRPHNAQEVAASLRYSYGPDSLLSRGADALAAIATATEEGTQVPLDRVNSITGTIIGLGGRALGFDTLPEFRLRSRISGDKAGVSLSTHW